MKRIVIPIVLLLAGAAIAGHLWWQQSHPEPAHLTLYGNVDIREVEMAFRQSGRIARLNYDEGTSVRSGDVLAELDPQPFSDAVAVAEANKAQAQAELQKLTAGSRPQEIAHAEQAVVQAEAAMTEAQRQYERQSKLFSGHAITQSAFDSAREGNAVAAARRGTTGGHRSGEGARRSCRSTACADAHRARRYATRRPERRAGIRSIA
jgi:HlyD family secretion protein